MSSGKSRSWKEFEGGKPEGPVRMGCVRGRGGNLYYPHKATLPSKGEGKSCSIGLKGQSSRYAQQKIFEGGERLLVANGISRSKPAGGGGGHHTYLMSVGE